MKYRLNMETARIEDATALMSLADERGVKFVLLTNAKGGGKAGPTRDSFLARESTKVIFNEMKKSPTKEFGEKDFEGDFKKMGLSPQSVSPVLSQLKTFGLIKKISKGKYRFS